MPDDTKIIRKTHRLNRATELENGFLSAFLRAGFWCHRITAHQTAPLFTVPFSLDRTRAPDLIVFDTANRYMLFEIKESLVKNSHITLYTEQIRDYMNLIDLNFKIIVCASQGDYCGYVGTISLFEINDLVNLSEQNEKILIPEMALEIIGRYRDTNIELLPHKLKTLIHPCS